MDNLGGSKQTGAAAVTKYHVSTRRQKEIKAEMSAIKSEDSWSKFLQTLQKQRQCASLRYSMIMMLAGRILLMLYARQLVYL
jgi:hypothetical protein